MILDKASGNGVNDVAILLEGAMGPDVDCAGCDQFLAAQCGWVFSGGGGGGVHGWVGVGLECNQAKTR